MMAKLKIVGTLWCQLRGIREKCQIEFDDPIMTQPH